MTLKKKSPAELEGEEYLKISELARLLPETTRPILAKYVAFDLLPSHIPEGKLRKYYRLLEVKKVLKALDPLRSKEIPLKYLRAELERLPWYKETRAREAGVIEPTTTKSKKQ
jgi:hypothetical protein